MTRKDGWAFSLYRIECLTGLTHGRLRQSLSELVRLGFVDESTHITERGYRFLSDVNCKVIPVLERYGMWRSNP